MGPMSHLTERADPMELESVLSERGVATVVLNRPERGNACNPRLLSALKDRLNACAGDTAARILLLRGKGKHFCTGADLQDREPDPSLPPASFAEIIATLDAFPKPTVALVQGGAIGAGAGLAAACDVTLADPDSFFSIPEVRFGRVPGAIGGVLIRAMGERNFRRYALSGERIDAEEARRIGLVHRLVPGPECDEVLEALLDSLLHGAPIAQADTKKLVLSRRVSAAHAPEEKPDAEEVREGVAAFREKREPRWYR